METSKIRDKLLEQRALYQQSIKAADEEAKAFKEIISDITDEQKVLMQSVLGADYFDLSTIDLDRIKEDRSYLEECQRRYEKLINGLHRYLEEAIGV